MSAEFGTWTEKGSERSSNFREFSNFVVKLQREADKCYLTGAGLFLFIDNSPTEFAFYNGMSPSKLLFDLVLIIRFIQLKCSTKIHIIHVAVTRMISHGTDELSSGNLNEGVLSKKYAAMYSNKSGCP